MLVKAFAVWPRSQIDLQFMTLLSLPRLCFIVAKVSLQLDEKEAMETNHNWNGRLPR